MSSMVYDYIIVGGIPMSSMSHPNVIMLSHPVHFALTFCMSFLIAKVDRPDVFWQTDYQKT